MFEKIKKKLENVNIDKLTFEELLIYVKIKKIIAEYNAIVEINNKNMEDNKKWIIIAKQVVVYALT